MVRAAVAARRDALALGVGASGTDTDKKVEEVLEAAVHLDGNVV